MNKEFNDFASTVFDAYTSFRTAGFKDAQAFAMATSFMVAMINRKTEEESKAGS